VRLAAVFLCLAAPCLAGAAGDSSGPDGPAASAGSPRDGGEIIESHARWAFEASNLSALVNRADLIVIATWRDALPGRQVELAEGIFLPFTLNRFTADTVVRGDIAPGAEIVLEQTGGMIGERRWQVDDGGPYQAGRYLLFLKRQQDSSYYYLIHPKGRYKIQAQRLLSHLPDDEVVGRITRQRLADVVAELRALRPR